LRRQATSLLKFAQETGDPRTATILLARAATLNEQIEDDGSPEPDSSLQAPDVEPDSKSA
jgi:hypothetical protein